MLSPVGQVTGPNLEPDVWRVPWQAVLPLTRVGTSQKAGAMEEEGLLKSQRPQSPCPWLPSPSQGNSVDSAGSSR